VPTTSHLVKLGEVQKVIVDFFEKDVGDAYRQENLKLFCVHFIIKMCSFIHRMSLSVISPVEFRSSKCLARETTYGEVPWAECCSNRQNEI
jgi:hypothetical protein